MRNKHVIKAVEDTEKIFIPAYREIYRILRGSLAVTNDDLISMGLPPHPAGGGGDPSPVELYAPEVYAEYITEGEMKIHAYPKGKKIGAAKNDGQHGFECKIRIGGTEPPKDVEDLAESLFSTRSYILFKFKQSQRGLTLWFAVRWENTRGEKGPWSVIFSVIIP
jgi:hypothetical protein